MNKCILYLKPACPISGGNAYLPENYRLLMLTYSAPVALLCSDTEDTVSAPLYLLTLSSAFFHFKFPPSAGSKGEVEAEEHRMLGDGYVWGNADVFPDGTWSFSPWFWIWLNSVTLKKTSEYFCLGFLFPIEWA